MAVEIVSQERNLLGECPIWCQETNTLFWVDSRAPALQTYRPDTGDISSHPLSETTGSVCLTEQGDLLVAMTSGIYRLGFDGTVGTQVANATAGHPDNRFNDGRCDRQGRFWVGSMNDKARIPTGALWRLSADHSISLMEPDLIVPNSLAFSPDNSRLYLSDTYRHRIFVFDYHPDDGTISNKRLFSDMEGWTGRPDGSAIDAEGCLWNAEYSGGRVVRYTPDGRIDRTIELPVSQVSCCAFGGKDLDELYITTARQRLTPEQLAAQPLAGCLFVARPGVKGLPEGRYAG